jgi:MFS family permease
MRGSGLTSTPAVSGSNWTRQQWLICAVAAIGFAFDTYELLMVPLIVRPALIDLTHARPDSAEFGRWVGIMFYVPAIAGGIFGLLGGYLTDRLGRRRVLVWSIVVYGVSALASAYATSVGVWLALRCATCSPTRASASGCWPPRRRARRWAA